MSKIEAVLACDNPATIRRYPAINRGAPATEPHGPAIIAARSAIIATDSGTTQFRETAV